LPVRRTQTGLPVRRTQTGPQNVTLIPRQYINRQREKNSVRLNKWNNKLTKSYEKTV